MNERHPNVVGLVPAAGSGSRFGGDSPKQFLEIAGKTLIRWSLERLRAGGVGRIVVALPAGTGPEEAGIAVMADVEVVAGGATRQESVARCLAAAGAEGEDLVVVHDAARAAVDPEDVRAVIAAASNPGGAVLGRAMSDTVKRVRGGGIEGTLDRAGLWRAETPQVLRAEILARALALAEEEGFVGTDEASLVERLAEGTITAVEARHPNPKLTLASDERWIALLLRGGGS